MQGQVSSAKCTTCDSRVINKGGKTEKFEDIEVQASCCSASSPLVSFSPTFCGTEQTHRGKQSLKGLSSDSSKQIIEKNVTVHTLTKFPMPAHIL